MRFFSAIVAIISLSSLLMAGSPEKYAEVRIGVPDRATLAKIWKAGVDFEGSTGKIGGWMTFITGSHERQELTASGIQYTVTQEDRVRPVPLGFKPGPLKTQGFGYGSWSGFYTYEEVKNQLDSMKVHYPDLITSKDNIGSTGEGRNIWIVKISDNPDLNEANEPEVLYTALHHAREPEGMMAVLYYMWWLLENYGTDPEATYLVNNRQMWFLPVVNPDGYSYNQQLYYPGTPAYGWRKNRRYNGDGSYGVDLNRNYGPYAMWNGPSGGSSTVPGSDVYRGPSPFSEPEILAMYDFLALHDVKTCLNYHTFGNYLIYPFSYIMVESPDSLIFREFTFDMTGVNRYIYGTDLQTVNYSTRGGSDDFMYGDPSKPQTFALTPEVGTTGFWPSIGEIYPLAIENLKSNQYYSYVAGQYSVLKNFELTDASGDGFPEPGETFSLSATVRNKGFGDESNLLVAQSASSADLQFDYPSRTISTLPARTDSVVIFTGRVRPDAKINSEVRVYLTMSDPAGYLHRDTITFIVGKPVVIFEDDASGGTGSWNTGEEWGTTSDSHTPPSAFTDSPGGDYDPSADNSFTLNSTLNLAGMGHCILKFWTRWAIKPTFDFGKVEVSTDGGSSWTTLQGSLSHKGSGMGVQYPGEWGYDGYTPELIWVEQEMDLSPLANRQVNLRFRLDGDGNGSRDGWYIDDIRVLGYKGAYQISKLSVTDNGLNTSKLTFGENHSATSGLDPAFGETELSPKPPHGTFDARWKIPSTLGTMTDVRDTLSSGNPSNTFTAEFQGGLGGYPFVLKWNPHGFNQGGWRLRDALTHGANFYLNMWTDTAFTVNDTAIHAVEIVHQMTDTVVVGTRNGWDILTVPIVMSDLLKRHLYPNALSAAFAYQGSYVPKDTLEYERGYWMKYSGILDTIRMAGVPIVLDTIQIPAGWWMLGGMSCTLPSSQMECSPSPCLPFAYNTHYITPPLTLVPGEGFWIKGPKTMILSCLKPGGPPLLKDPIAEDLSLLNSLTVYDKSGNSQSLYFGRAPALNLPLSAYELPPLPPSGAFDARFQSQLMVETFSGGAKAPAQILIQSSAYPLKLHWNVKASDNTVYELTDGGGKTLASSLASGGGITINDPAVTSLRLRPVTHETRPLEFAVSQNYPNPFNPTTSVGFDVPVPSHITLKIFNALGQEVQTVINGQYYGGGRYDVGINGSDLTSGIYFYRFTASAVGDKSYLQITKKMLLIK